MKKLLVALNQKPIAFYPIYADITGSITAGVLLSQAMYWFSQMGGEKFYKSDHEFMKETRLTQTEFKNAKKCIAELPFISIIRDRKSNKTYYFIDSDSLAEVIDRFEPTSTGSRNNSTSRGDNLRRPSEVTYEDHGRLPTKTTVGYLPTFIGTENTTKTTSENTTLVAKEFATVLHDQVEDTKIELFDSFEDLAIVQDNAELDVDIKEKPPRKGTTKARTKVEDPTPIDAMWQIVLEQCNRIGNPEPEFEKRYLRDFKMLYVKLKGRAERMNEPIPNPAEPFRRYCTKIANFIIEGRKNSQAQFNANRLAQNFNPGFMHNSFNSICATIQAGVTQGKQIQPTRYDEKEVYANYDSSQAAF